MTDKLRLEGLRDALFQADRGLYLAPIRHHSPACAWALRSMIHELKPSAVLIEAPVEFERHIDLVLDEATRPPVAIVSLIEHQGETRSAAYYPFCAHSPEYVALQEGRALGADLRFIDLPAADKAGNGSPEKPTTLTDETRFDSGAYVAALAKRTGCRDGYELWDHMFETRLGQDDWRGFFADVGVYCAGIRAATAPERIETGGDAARERQMAACVAKALAIPRDSPVIAVIGGFHAEGLLDGLADAPQVRPASQDRSYLIRYGFRALDALNGYGAGLPQPGYYQALWQRANAAGGALPWRDTAADLVSDFTAAMRTEGHAISLPAQVEILRAAECLALLRNRPGALRHDLIDATRSALVKGETGLAEVWTERLLSFLCGDTLGDIPASAGSPPLVEDARARARAHRIDVSDGSQRRRKLDIRRKPAHLATSRFLHAMTLLDTRFAARETGPDYLNNARTELLFEEWSYAWSPQVESRLVELSTLGDRIPTAALNHIWRTRARMGQDGRAHDLDLLVQLFERGLLAGLGAELAPYLVEMGAVLANHGTFDSAAMALRRLCSLSSAKGPLALPEALDPAPAVDAAYGRILYLADTLPQTPEDEIAPRLDAIRLVAELLRGPDGASLDAALFDDAMERVVTSKAPPEILGAVLAALTLSGRAQPATLLGALDGNMAGAVLDQAARIGVLRGVLHTAPSLLWQIDALLARIDNFLQGLDETEFIDLLPHLRLAFTALNPREADRLAEMIARQHGLQTGAITARVHSATEADLKAGLALDKALRASLAADGLGIAGEMP